MMRSYVVATILSCLACGCVGSPDKAEPVREEPQDLLRLETHSEKDRIDVWVVGALMGRMHNLQTDAFRIATIEARRDGKEVLATHVFVQSQDASKYGPYVSIAVDAGELKGIVRLDATILYRGTHYELHGTYRAPRDNNEDRRWITVSQEIRPR